MSSLGSVLTEFLQVTDVFDDGPCAGIIETGDIITHLGSTKVEGKPLSDFTATLPRNSNNDIELSVRRGIFLLFAEQCIQYTSLECGFRRRRNLPYQSRQGHITTFCRRDDATQVKSNTALLVLTFRFI